MKEEAQRLMRVFQPIYLIKGVGVDAIMVIGNKKKTTLLGHFHQVYLKHLSSFDKSIKACPFSKQK